MSTLKHPAHAPNIDAIIQRMSAGRRGPITGYGEQMTIDFKTLSERYAIHSNDLSACSSAYLLGETSGSEFTSPVVAFQLLNEEKSKTKGECTTDIKHATFVVLHHLHDLGNLSTRTDVYYWTDCRPVILSRAESTKGIIVNELFFTWGSTHGGDGVTHGCTSCLSDRCRSFRRINDGSVSFSYQHISLPHDLSTIGHCWDNTHDLGNRLVTYDDLVMLLSKGN